LITPTVREVPEDLLRFISLEPRLYVLSRPVLDSRGIARFAEEESTQWNRTVGSTDAEEIIEFAGRICYMSFGSNQSPKSNREYIQALVAEEHDSVLEHASWTFLLTGVSRAFTHQMVRHRIGFSFSQLSQQYHDETTAKFVIPEEVKANPKVMDLWLRLIEQLKEGYRSISSDLKAGELGLSSKEHRRSIRSAARSILPNATETKIVFSANGRALRHFLKMRGAIAGDLEMRRVSALIYSRLAEEAPALLSGFELIAHDDGYPLIRRQERQRAPM
jgi:thymidylate synthase (FAD)